jgi:flotillin
MNYFWLIPVVLVVVILIIFATRYRTAKADRAMIVTGARIKEGSRIVKTGGVYVWPIIQNAEFLSLRVQTVEVRTPEMYTSEGFPVMVEGVAQIKVKGDEESIAVAAEHFLGKPEEEIRHVAMQMLEGYLRSILGQITMEEIYKNRDKLAKSVQEMAVSDLNKMGLQIISFSIKDVKDTTGYLEALGQSQIASLKRDAEIAKANALRDEQVAKAKALEESKKAEFAAEMNIAEALKELEVKKTAFQLEHEMRRLEAEQSIRLQEVKLSQNVKAEEMAAQIMEKEKLNELEAKELERREKLEASMKKSEALSNAQEQQAEADRYHIEARAKGYAVAIRLSGQTNADHKNAEAEVIELIGVAKEEEKDKIAGRTVNSEAIIIDQVPPIPSDSQTKPTKNDEIFIDHAAGPAEKNSKK